MRVEIGVFVAETPLSDQDALRRYRAHRGESDPDRESEPDARIVAFLGELLARYPAPDSLSAEDRPQSPWAAAIEASDNGIRIALGGSHCADAIEYILELAEKHALVCFDPKTRSILTAPPGIYIERQSYAAMWPLTLATLSLALIGVLWLH